MLVARGARLLTALCGVVAMALTAADPTPAAAAGVGPLSVQPHSVVDSDWTAFDQNSSRTGVDSSGNSFSPAAAAWTSPTLDGQLYGQPLVYGGRVFVATENDTVYALAANSGAVLWSNHLATPVSASQLPCGDISPTVGITSTPVIDPARGEIFVVADESAPSVASHHLIGLDVYTGQVLLNQVIDPAGTVPADQLQRASLALDEGRVIAGFGGNAGDCGTYHGMLVSTPEGGGPITSYVVADQPGDGQGAIWMGGAAPTIDSQGDIWVATGNSAFHSSTDNYDESDGVLKISPSMQLLDYFAPSDWYSDNADDFDLGSTAPALLPNGLVFEVGKSTTAYVLHGSDLGHVGGQVAETDGFCSGDPDGGDADLDGTLFVPCNNGIHAVTPTASPPVATWTTSSGAHGSPIVAGGLVWSIGNGNLYALDPSTGDAEQQFSIGPSASSFPSPSAADGLVLAPSAPSGVSQGTVHAFEGPGGLPGPPSPPPPPCAVPDSAHGSCLPVLPPPGYDLVASDGGVFTFGNAGFYGSMGGTRLNAPIVGTAATPDDEGYWEVAADGGVFAFGDARFYGSMGGTPLNAPIVGMATTLDGGGYWEVAADGGVFAFGDARFYGSMGGTRLNAPIVGMAASPNGGGYWEVAADGGIFTFGYADFYGSMGGTPLNAPIVGMAADGDGYWEVAADGGVFAFGAARFHGSMGGTPLNAPIVGMAVDDISGGGYWEVAADGGIFAFGDADFLGSMGGTPLNAPVVGMVSAPLLP